MSPRFKGQGEGWLTVVRRDQALEVSAVSALALDEIRGGSRVIWISDGGSYDALIALGQPAITINLNHLTGVELALLMIDLAARDIADHVIFCGGPPQIGAHLARLRWALARLNTRCTLLVDGSLSGDGLL